MHRAYLAEQKRLYDAAACLQAILRTRAMVAHFKLLLKDFFRERAACAIQRHWRGVLGRRCAREKLEEKMLEELSHAALLVQKNWRRYSCQKRFKAYQLRRNASILYMQSMWRMKMARRDRRRRIVFNTTVKLQARFRGKKSRRRALAHSGSRAAGPFLRLTIPLCLITVWKVVWWNTGRLCSAVEASAARSCTTSTRSSPRCPRCCGGAGRSSA